MAEFGGIFDNDDELPEGFDPMMSLTPKDALALAVSVFHTMQHPMVDIMIYPGWQDDAVAAISRCITHMSEPLGIQPLDLPNSLIKIAVTAIVVACRIRVEEAEKNGEILDPRDQSHELCDPAAVLEKIAESIPDDAFFDRKVEFVKELNKVYDAKQDERQPPPQVSDEQAKQLEEWFNGDEAEEPPNA